MTAPIAPSSGFPRESYRDVVSRLGSAQKKRARGAPAYSVYINRPIGRRLAALAFLAGLTPNGVSAVSAVFTFGAIVVIAILPTALWTGVLIAALLVIGYAFDSADGQLARLRGGGTASGEWLDHVLDSVKTSTLHLAVLITAFLHFDLSDAAWYLVPLGFSAVAAISFFASILNDQLRSRYRSKLTLGGSKESSLVRSLLGAPTDYGVLCLSFILIGWPLVFFTVYTLLFLANGAYLLMASVKWFREMSDLGAERTKS
ncbi:CDP-alcohol phosphatidyltransferase family protein [Microbacterium sp. STN6]|uniref:CDP-alcohol phosphatidyltransferase family protein n=1 Tax=Microbacterium sp. STN6 TaxID=2995588 RepID=UPI0022608DC5|nr:CDP-alcohol phosphatidyltransferase family protein [Microbacterium sp. STN6]MCX7523035.1 CDP-alcohol phosphatidyltransferase family protein [Microbacterium sp. STN6]